MSDVGPAERAIERSPRQRAVAVILALTLLALWIAALAWLRSNPGSIWWWVAGPAIALFFVVETIQKLRPRVKPVDALLDSHVRYLLAGTALVFGGGVGLFRSENGVLDRVVLVSLVAAGAVVLVAGIRDLARWRAEYRDTPTGGA